MDFADIFRTFHHKEEDYTFFLSAHGKLSRWNHILGHKLALNPVQNIEIVLRVFADHNALNLKVKDKEKFQRDTNIQNAKEHPSKEWMDQPGSYRRI